MATEAAPTEPPWGFKLARLKVVDADVDFADESLPIPFKRSISALNGNIGTFRYRQPVADADRAGRAGRRIRPTESLGGAARARPDAEHRHHGAVRQCRDAGRESLRHPVRRTQSGERQARSETALRVARRHPRRQSQDRAARFRARRKGAVSGRARSAVWPGNLAAEGLERQHRHRSAGGRRRERSDVPHRRCDHEGARQSHHVDRDRAVPAARSTGRLRRFGGLRPDLLHGRSRRSGAAGAGESREDRRCAGDAAESRTDHSRRDQCGGRQPRVARGGVTRAPRCACWRRRRGRSPEDRAVDGEGEHPRARSGGTARTVHGGTGTGRRRRVRRDGVSQGAASKNSSMSSRCQQARWTDWPRNARLRCERVLARMRRSMRHAYPTATYRKSNPRRTARCR